MASTAPRGLQQLPGGVIVPVDLMADAALLVIVQPDGQFDFVTKGDVRQWSLQFRLEIAENLRTLAGQVQAGRVQGIVP